MRDIGGCVGCLLLVIAAPLLPVIVVGMAFTSEGTPTAPQWAQAVRQSVAPPPYQLSSGPIYPASTRSYDGNPSLSALNISDLGFGASDARRVDEMIRAINPRSPLVGQGALLIDLAHKWRVDPLLIAQKQFESSMATAGKLVSSYNWGSISWPAAQEATQLYGCVRGIHLNGRHWARCPDPTSGLRLWADYVHTYYTKVRKTRYDLYVNAYNPCSDPYNIKLGFRCGTSYGQAILATIRNNAPPPITTPMPGPVVIGGDFYQWQGDPATSWDIPHTTVCHAAANCGPTSVAMAIRYATGRAVTARDVRRYATGFSVPCDEGTNSTELNRSLAHWSVPYRNHARPTLEDLRAMVARGHIALVSLTMKAIRPGADYRVPNSDPRQRVGDFANAAGHWLVVVGLEADGDVIVYDPNQWPTRNHWYSDNTPKGKARVYPAAEFYAAMRVHRGGYAIEIPVRRSRA